MPRNAWTGYQRFCPLARGLDVLGERWTLVIVQELMTSAARYGELHRRLPGVGTSVLADRLRDHGMFHVVTDWPGYAEHIRDILAANPEMLRSNAELPPRLTTKIERRGQKLGHPVWEAVYLRQTRTNSSTKGV